MQLRRWNPQKIDRKNDQLPIEFQQLENYNQYLANECRRDYNIFDRQNKSLKNEKAKT